MKFLKQCKLLPRFRQCRITDHGENFSQYSHMCPEGSCRPSVHLKEGRAPACKLGVTFQRTGARCPAGPNLFCAPFSSLTVQLAKPSIASHQLNSESGTFPVIHETESKYTFEPFVETSSVVLSNCSSHDRALYKGHNMLCHVGHGRSRRGWLILSLAQPHRGSKVAAHQGSSMEFLNKSTS